MGSRRLSNKDPQPDRFRIQQGSSTQGRQSYRPSRTSFDCGGGQPSSRSTLGRASRTPMKAPHGGNGGSSRSTYSGRTSRTPLRQSRPSNRSTFGRPRLSSLSKGDSSQSKDPRDLKSKAFQSSAISCLIDFLARKGFNQPLSRKALSSPSTREFKTIFEFMVLHVIPHYNIDASGLKLEQEVHNVFRDLGYTYMLNKQHLATVGAPHSWPYALGALDWLREVLELEDAIENGESGPNLCDDESSFGLSADSAEIRQVFLKHEASAYQQYLETGVLPTYDAFVEELDKVMLDGFDENDLKALREEREMLHRELEERRSREDPSRDVQLQLDEKMATEHDHLEQLTAIETEMESNSAEIGAAVETREAAVQRKVDVEEEITRVKEIVDKQPMRREDVEKLLLRRKNLQAELDHQERVNIDLFDSIGVQERQVAGMMESIEPKTIALCRKANELGLLERFPSLQIGVSQLREPDSFVPQVQSILSNSIEEELKTDIENAKSRLNQEVRRSEQVSEELRQSALLERSHRERVDILDEEIRRTRERVHIQEESMVEERLSWERNQLNMRESVTHQEKELREATERVRRAEEALRIRDAELASIVAARETECRDLAREVRRVLKLSSEFGEYMQSLAKSVVTDSDAIKNFM